MITVMVVVTCVLSVWLGMPMLGVDVTISEDHRAVTISLEY